jgi:diguanylate cyclase (GGDEF)-like protein/PAS domain S-box-containing protein
MALDRDGKLRHFDVLRAVSGSVAVMEQVIPNIASLGLLVFLFTAIVRRAPDDRLRCWVAAWICILVHTVLKLWTPVSPFWRSTSVCASVDSLALAAIFLLMSTMIVREGRKAGLRFGGVLALFTLPCLTMSIAQPSLGALLAVLALARQAVAIRLAMRPRLNRRSVLWIVIPACALSLACMLYGIGHGHSEIIVLALLGEMFIAAGANFWFAGWERSLGLSTTCTGLIAFGAMFPAMLFIHQSPAASSASIAVFGISLFCAAIGMILIVFEEDLRSVRQTTEEYRLTFDTNPHPLWIYDAETLEFLAVNQAACSTHGHTREEFAKLKLPDIVDKREMPQVLRQVALSAPSPNRESRHIRKDGTILPMDITAHSIVFRGRPARFVLGIDVSEREELQRQVLHHSRHDSLTGLPNRTLFEEQLDAALALWIRMRSTLDRDEKLGIVCLNLDRFKRINDTYGIWVGDECLKKVAEILRAKAGPTDLVARTGGDRFALVLTGLRSSWPAEVVLSELMEALREPLVVGRTKVRLSVSAGLAFCPDDGVAVMPMWRSAEGALSRARAAGGGQVVWSNSELRIAAEQQVDLEAFMRTQLEEHGFHLEYQPIFAMDGRVEGLEALLRLTHPVHGPISPGRLIPLAEETGLIVPLGDWVIEEVCRQLCTWRENGVRLVPIAVNVSGHQLMRGGFAERLVGIISRFQINPGQIDLEVTESADMFNVTEVTRQMTLLSEIGIRFSIDDFGTGHSTLNRLDKLPLSVLKVDRTFTERLCEVDGSRSIVQAMISMAKALNMRVVAEGVELEEQLEVLKEMGCNYLQGYLLSRPIPPNAIPDVMHGRHPLLADRCGASKLVEEYSGA